MLKSGFSSAPEKNFAKNKNARGDTMVSLIKYPFF